MICVVVVNRNLLIIRTAPGSFKQETSFCDGNKICPGRISSPQGGEALAFRVVSISRPGAVRLKTEDGKPMQNLWNIEHLRKYHLRQFYP